MKKFLLIPILIFVYIFFIDILLQTNFQSAGISGSPKGGVGEVLNIGQSIGVSVRRPYFFGLIYLPVYTESLGDIGLYHDAFFSFIFILTIALIIIEIKNRKEIKGRKAKRNKRR
jgi:hypothetical protein